MLRALAIDELDVAAIGVGDSHIFEGCGADYGYCLPLRDEEEWLGDWQVEVVLDAAEVPPEEGVALAGGLGGGLWGLLAVEHADGRRGGDAALGVEGDGVGVGLPARDEVEGLGDRQVEVVLDAAEVPPEEGVALSGGLKAL